MRALIVEDDPVFASALARAVRGLGDGWTVDIATTLGEGLRAVGPAGDGLRLALIDLHLPDGPGLEVIRALKARRADVPALVISSVASERGVLDAIAEGARGYLHKSEPMHALAVSMSQVMQGQYPISPSLARHLFNIVRPEGTPLGARSVIQLTPKESQTLRCISHGMSYNETAASLGVSLSTVQSHIRSLYRKLEVRSQVQAVGKARAEGLL